MALSIMFLAGDPSGDQHCSMVVRTLRETLPGARLWGIGGPAMEREGFEPVMPFAPFNRMGFQEVLPHMAFFLRAQKKVVALMKEHKPQALVCVDYSGFNIPMMKAAKGLGIPVAWYIAPMVWAWKPKRAKVLGEYASHIAVIFPFEVPYFSPYGAVVSFVGNPTVEEMALENAFAKAPRRHPGTGQFRLAIAPGSRRQEIEHMLPLMVEAYAILKKRFPGLRATVSRYHGLPAEFYRKVIGDAPLELFDGPLRDMLGRADFALVTSGTATLETALLGVPLIIAYHTSYVTYSIMKRLIRIPHVGLPNIIAGEAIVPECIQHQSEPANLALTLEHFIESPKLYNNTVKKLVALREKLGEKRPSVEVGDIVKGLAEKKPF